MDDTTEQQSNTEQQPDVTETVDAKSDASPAAGGTAPAAKGGSSKGGSNSSGRRRHRWTAFSAAYTVAIVVILILANVVGAQTKVSWDVTVNHSNTLSPQTVSLLKELKEPVTIVGFYSSGSQIQGGVEALVKEYKATAGDKIQYQAVDPNVHPALAEKYSVTEADSVVVALGDQHQTLHSWEFYSSSGTWDGEQALTNAILRVAHPKQLNVYFVTGHGELSNLDQLSPLSQSLQDQGYTVDSLNLLQKNGVPKDASAVIIAAPHHDFTPQEIGLLETYAKNGGHVLVMRDPATPHLPLFDGMLTEWGVTPQTDVAVDPTRHFLTEPVAVIPLYGDSDIVSPMETANTPTVMPESLSWKYSQDDSRITPLLTTTSDAWGETDFQATPKYDKGTDLKGPLTLGVSIDGLPQGSGSGASEAAPGTSETAPSGSETAPGTAGTFRAVVFGSDIFATGQWYNLAGNQDLLLNSVSWLAGRTQGVTLRPKPLVNQPMAINGSQASRLFMGTVIVLPILVLIAGAIVWWRRRLL